MNLYLLSALTQPVDYDCVSNLVVRAKSQKRARELAGVVSGDEGAEFWLDKKKSSCISVTQEGDEGVIIEDRRPG